MTTPACLLDAGFDLTLRPMRYPRFYEMYRGAIKNTWTVEEIDFQIDLGHLRTRMTPAERHLIERLVAFFATGDSIVSNNLVISLYRHINAPEARMYLSRQLYEEALHVQFYLTLLDNYVSDPERRAQAFAAIENIPSIRRKAQFCQKWIDAVATMPRINDAADKRQFLLNLTCFAACIEGLFFFGAFAYVYFLRWRRARPGCSGTRAPTWPSPSRSSARSGPRSRSCSTPPGPVRSCRCSRKPSSARASSRRTYWPAGSWA